MYMCFHNFSILKSASLFEKRSHVTLPGWPGTFHIAKDDLVLLHPLPKFWDNRLPHPYHLLYVALEIDFQTSCMVDSLLTQLNL